MSLNKVNKQTGATSKVAGGAGSGGSGWTPHCIIYADTGSTVTAVKGSKTVNAVETSEGTFECDLPGNDYGEWTFTATLNGSSLITTVNVLVVQTYNVHFINGKTVTPIDDVTILLECAGIYGSEISTINELLADTDILPLVISSNNAIDYIARSAEWASTFANDGTATSLIGLNNYASRTLLESGMYWREAICNSTYRENILNKKVPVMISNNQPKGELYTNGGGSLYLAFDGDPNTKYVGSNFIYNADYTQNPWKASADVNLQYDFGETVYIYCCDMTVSNPGVPSNSTLRGSNDNITFTPMTEQFGGGGLHVVQYTGGYRIIRLHYKGTVSNYSTTSNLYYPQISTMQFYGREDI